MTNKEQQIARMKELGELLRNASKAYYAEDREIMSNLEYDKLYDELEALEKETGTVLSGSPTMTVGYEAVDELPKERHASPMLSLDKTKDVGELAAFAGDHEVLLSWKLDGLTVVLTYENGQLSKAVTRGNGEVGEVITNNAKVFKNVPLTIPCKEQVILRGEAVIRYSDFERINEEIEDEAAKYKNPRNLCSGSIVIILFAKHLRIGKSNIRNTKAVDHSGKSRMSCFLHTVHKVFIGFYTHAFHPDDLFFVAIQTEQIRIFLDKSFVNKFLQRHL